MSVLDAGSIALAARRIFTGMHAALPSMRTTRQASVQAPGLALGGPSQQYAGIHAAEPSHCFGRSR